MQTKMKRKGRRKEMRKGRREGRQERKCRKLSFALTWHFSPAPFPSLRTPHWSVHR